MSWLKRNTFDVFVGNLPGYIDKGYIDHLFRKCGEIASVTVLPSKYGGGKLAYVRFHCEPDALKAVETYRTLTLNGNTLEVKLLPRKHQNNSSVKSASHSSNSGNCDTSSCSFNETRCNEITIVCHVENPVTFYGQRLSNLLELVQITEKLQACCPSFYPVQGLPHANQIYAARFSQDKLWYRCRIIRPDIKKSFVSYIDYGNSEAVNNSDIVALPDDLVRIPPQSSMFVFKDLDPVSSEEKRDVYDKAVAYLKKMLNEKVHLDIVFSTDSFSYITKCAFQNMDVYEELQKKGFAKKVQGSSEKSPPEKNKVNVSGNEGKDLDSLTNSKRKSQQNFSNKVTASKVTSPPKKQPAKNSVKENLELGTLRLQNAELAKKLAMEKEKSTALAQENEILKSRISGNCFEKLDFGIKKVQELMALRNQDPSEEADNLEEIYGVIEAKYLRGIQESHLNPNLHSKVENAILEYQKCIEEFETKDQASDISAAVIERDEKCQSVCVLMKEYLESWNGDHLTERVVFLKKLLLEMKQKYEEYLKTNISCSDRTLEDLIGEYKENKLKNKTSMETALKNTNDALSKFSSVIDDLKKDITVPTEKPTFSTAAFSDSFKEVQQAVNTEITTRKMPSKNLVCEATMTSLVKILIKEIETPLEATLQEIKDCKQYNLLYPKMYSNLMTKPDTTKIYEIRKEIKTLKSKLRHKLADKRDIEESDEVNTSALKEINASIDSLLYELHTHFKSEHEEMMKLASAYKSHFRELNVNNPDLNLPSYVKYDGLVKENWEMEHFKFCSIADRPGVCYATKFCDEPVVIKEYHLNNDEYSQLLKKILQWNSIKEDNVVPVRSVFRSKTGFQTYAMFPSITTLEESVKESPLSQECAFQVLVGILKGLVCIHSRNLIHSQLSPSTIFFSSGTLLLDLSFGQDHKAPVYQSKGIKFCPPEKKMTQASDMYNFGCLVLWMLFPNLQFACAPNGALDVAGYKSIVQDVLSNRSYRTFASLLSSNAAIRPSAKSLLEKGIFEMPVCNSSKEDTTPVSTPVAQPSGEVSISVSAASEEASETASETSMPVADSSASETSMPVADSSPSETSMPVAGSSASETGMPVADSLASETVLSAADSPASETVLSVADSPASETVLSVADSSASETVLPVVDSSASGTVLPVADSSTSETVLPVADSSSDG